MKRFNLNLILIFLTGVFIGAVGVVVFLKIYPTPAPKTATNNLPGFIPGGFGGMPLGNLPKSTGSGRIEKP